MDTTQFGFKGQGKLMCSIKREMFGYKCCCPHKYETSLAMAQKRIKELKD